MTTPSATYTHSPELTQLLADAVGAENAMALGVGTLEFDPGFIKEEGYRLRIPSCLTPFDTIAVYHDSRGAPYAADAEGDEHRNLLISFTDDGSATLCAWARIDEKSRVLGIGIDLCAPEDFPSDEFHDKIHPLIFSPKEDEAGRLAYPNAKSKGSAYAFSGKEAAFKATSHALREHYRHSDTEYYYEMSYFEVLPDATAHGADPDGAVERALKGLEVERIELSHIEYAGMVCTVAVALKAH